jgi:hypothetical protein
MSSTTKERTPKLSREEELRIWREKKAEKKKESTSSTGSIRRFAGVSRCNNGSVNTTPSSRTTLSSSGVPRRTLNKNQSSTSSSVSRSERTPCVRNQNGLKKEAEVSSSRRLQRRGDAIIGGHGQKTGSVSSQSSRTTLTWNSSSKKIPADLSTGRFKNTSSETTVNNSNCNGDVSRRVSTKPGGKKERYDSNLKKNITACRSSSKISVKELEKEPQNEMEKEESKDARIEEKAFDPKARNVVSLSFENYNMSPLSCSLKSFMGSTPFRTPKDDSSTVFYTPNEITCQDQKQGYRYSDIEPDTGKKTEPSILQKRETTDRYPPVVETPLDWSNDKRPPLFLGRVSFQRGTKELKGGACGGNENLPPPGGDDDDDDVFDWREEISPDPMSNQSRSLSSKVAYEDLKRKSMPEPEELLLDPVSDWCRPHRSPDPALNAPVSTATSSINDPIMSGPDEGEAFQNVPPTNVDVESKCIMLPATEPDKDDSQQKHDEKAGATSSINDHSTSELDEGEAFQIVQTNVEHQKHDDKLGATSSINDPSTSGSDDGEAFQKVPPTNDGTKCIMLPVTEPDKEDSHQEDDDKVGATSSINDPSTSELDSTAPPNPASPSNDESESIIFPPELNAEEPQQDNGENNINPKGDSNYYCGGKKNIPTVHLKPDKKEDFSWREDYALSEITSNSRSKRRTDASTLVESVRIILLPLPVPHEEFIKQDSAYKYKRANLTVLDPKGEELPGTLNRQDNDSNGWCAGRNDLNSESSQPDDEEKFDWRDELSPEVALNSRVKRRTDASMLDIPRSWSFEDISGDIDVIYLKDGDSAYEKTPKVERRDSLPGQEPLVRSGEEKDISNICLTLSHTDHASPNVSRVECQEENCPNECKGERTATSKVEQGSPEVLQSLSLAPLVGSFSSSSEVSFEETHSISPSDSSYGLERGNPFFENQGSRQTTEASSPPTSSAASCPSDDEGNSICDSEADDVVESPYLVTSNAICDPDDDEKVDDAVRSSCLVPESVVRVNEKTILDAIREGPPAGGSSTELEATGCYACKSQIDDLRCQFDDLRWQSNCLMMEKRKLENINYSFRKNYESRITPFRNIIEEVRQHIHACLSCAVIHRSTLHSVFFIFLRWRSSGPRTPGWWRKRFK